MPRGASIVVASGLVALGLWSGAPSPAAAVEFEQMRRGAFDDDLFVAGGWVDVEAEVDGDLFVTGGWIDVAATAVAGDLIAAGGATDIAARVAQDLIWAGISADIEGVVGDDLLAAGGLVGIEAEVAGKVMASGGRVRLGRRARVGDDAWLAGGSIEIAGRVGGDVAATGGRVLITGTITGDLEVVGGPLQIAPGAKVGGAVTAYGLQAPLVAAEAEVGGPVRHVPDEDAAEGPEVAAVEAEEEDGLGIGTVLFLLGIAAAGLAVELLLPGYAHAAARRLRVHPWQSLGLGIALVVAAPVVIALLIASVIGLPLGVTAAFGYLALLLLGWVVAAFSVSGLVAARWPAAARGRRRLPLHAGAVLALALLALIPVAGIVVVLTALLLGAGAAAAQAQHAWASGGGDAEEAPAAPG